MPSSLGNPKKLPTWPGKYQELTKNIIDLILEKIQNEGHPEYVDVILDGADCYNDNLALYKRADSKNYDARISYYAAYFDNIRRGMGDLYQRFFNVDVGKDNRWTYPSHKLEDTIKIIEGAVGYLKKQIKEDQEMLEKDFGLKNTEKKSSEESRGELLTVKEFIDFIEKAKDKIKLTPEQHKIVGDVNKILAYFDGDSKEKNNINTDIEKYKKLREVTRESSDEDVINWQREFDSHEVKLKNYKIFLSNKYFNTRESKIAVAYLVNREYGGYYYKLYWDHYEYFIKLKKGYEKIEPKFLCSKRKYLECIIDNKFDSLPDWMPKQYSALNGRLEEYLKYYFPPTDKRCKTGEISKLTKLREQESLTGLGSCWRQLLSSVKEYRDLIESILKGSDDKEFFYFDLNSKSKHPLVDLEEKLKGAYDKLEQARLTVLEKLEEALKLRKKEEDEENRKTAEELEKLKKDLDSAKAELESTKKVTAEKVGEYDAKIKVLQADLERAKTRAEEAEVKTKQAEDAAAAAEKAKSEALTRAEKAETKTKQSEETVKAKDAALTQTKNTAAAAQEALAKEKTRLEEAIKATQEAANKVKSAALAETAVKYARVKSLENQLKEAEEGKKQAQSEVDAQRADARKVQNEFEQAKKDADEARKKAGELEHAANAAKKLSEENIKAREEALGKLRDLEQKNEELKKNLDEERRKVTEKEQAQTKLEEDLKKAQDELANTKKSASEERDRLNKEIKVLTEQVEKIRSSMDQLNKDMAEKDRLAGEKGKEHEDYKNTKEAEIAAQKKSLEEMNARIDALNKEKTATEEQIRVSDKKVEEIEAKAKELEAQLTQARAQAKLEAAKVEEDKEQLKKVLENAKEELNKAKKAKETAIQEKQQAEANAQTAAKMASAAQERLKATQEEAKKAQEELEKIKQEQKAREEQKMANEALKIEVGKIIKIIRHKEDWPKDISEKLQGLGVEPLLTEVSKYACYYSDSSSLQKLRSIKDERGYVAEKLSVDKDYIEFCNYYDDYFGLESDTTQLPVKKALKRVIKILKELYSKLKISYEVCENKRKKFEEKVTKENERKGREAEYTIAQLFEEVQNGNLPKDFGDECVKIAGEIKTYLEYFTETKTSELQNLVDKRGAVSFTRGAGDEFIEGVLGDNSKYKRFVEACSQYTSKLTTLKEDKSKLGKSIAETLADWKTSLKPLYKSLGEAKKELEDKISEDEEITKDIAEKKQKAREKAQKEKAEAEKAWKEEIEGRKKARKQEWAKREEGEPQLTVGELLQSVIEEVKIKNGVGGIDQTKRLDANVAEHYADEIDQIKEMLEYYDGCYEKGKNSRARSIITKCKAIFGGRLHMGYMEEPLSVYNACRDTYNKKIWTLMESKTEAKHVEEGGVSYFDNEPIVGQLISELSGVYKELLKSEEKINEEIERTQGWKEALTDRYAKVSDDLRECKKSYEEKGKEIKDLNAGIPVIEKEITALENKLRKLEAKTTKSTGEKASYELDDISFDVSSDSEGKKLIEEISKKRKYVEEDYPKTLKQKTLELEDLSKQFEELSNEKIDLGRALISLGVEAKKADIRELNLQVGHTVSDLVANKKDIEAKKQELANIKKEIPKSRWDTFKAKLRSESRKKLKESREKASKKQAEIEEARKRGEEIIGRFNELRERQDELENPEYIRKERKEGPDYLEKGKGLNVRFMHRGETSQEKLDREKIIQQGQVNQPGDKEKAEAKKKEESRSNKLTPSEAAKCLKMCNDNIKVMEDFLKYYPKGFPFIGQKDKNVINKLSTNAKALENPMITLQRNPEIKFLFQSLEALFGEHGIMKSLAETKATKMDLGRIDFKTIKELISVRYINFKTNIGRAALVKKLRKMEEKNIDLSKDMKELEKLVGNLKKAANDVNEEMPDDTQISRWIKESRSSKSSLLGKIKEKTIGRFKEWICGSKDLELLLSNKTIAEQQYEQVSKGFEEFQHAVANDPRSVHNKLGTYSQIVRDVGIWLAAVSSCVPDIGPILSAAIGITSTTISVIFKSLKLFRINYSKDQETGFKKSNLYKYIREVIDKLEEANKQYEKILARGEKEGIGAQQYYTEKSWSDIIPIINGELFSLSRDCHMIIDNYEQYRTNLHIHEYLRALHRAKAMFKKIVNHLMDWEQYEHLDDKYKTWKESD